MSLDTEQRGWFGLLADLVSLLMTLILRMRLDGLRPLSRNVLPQIGTAIPRAVKMSLCLQKIRRHRWDRVSTDEFSARRRELGKPTPVWVPARHFTVHPSKESPRSLKQLYLCKPQRVRGIPDPVQVRASAASADDYGLRSLQSRNCASCIECGVSRTCANDQQMRCEFKSRHTASIGLV